MWLSGQKRLCYWLKITQFLLSSSLPRWNRQSPQTGTRLFPQPTKEPRQRLSKEAQVSRCPIRHTWDEAPNPRTMCLLTGTIFAKIIPRTSNLIAKKRQMMKSSIRALSINWSKVMQETVEKIYRDLRLLHRTRTTTSIWRSTIRMRRNPHRKSLKFQIKTLYLAWWAMTTSRGLSLRFTNVSIKHQSRVGESNRFNNPRLLSSWWGWAKMMK